MDSLSVRTEYGSQPKRIKHDADVSNFNIAREKSQNPNVSAAYEHPIDTLKDEEDDDRQVPQQNDLPSMTTNNAELNMLDVSQDSLDLDADDDNASTISQLSGLSDLSEDWKPMGSSMVWIQKQMQNGVDPRTLLTGLGADLAEIPQYIDDTTVWKLIINMLAEPPQRHKLRHVNTLDDVVRLLKGARNIIVLTGAGVSVSCGIPDFRSRDGIYLRLAADFPDLPDPQAMFDITYFNQDPRPFYKFAKDIYPGNFEPSPCHRFIKLLETQKKLLRNYTQNIDTLEKVATIDGVVECHGSFATASCTKCGHRVTSDEIREPILKQRIPLCGVCHGHLCDSINPDDLNGQKEELSNLVSSGIMKPDIVFFGEGLPDSFHEAISEDKTRCDLLLVIGSSLKVRPVALIPNLLPSNVPQILINREPLSHCRFDVELLGDCDSIINHLCQLLGQQWKDGVHTSEVLQETLHLLPVEEDPELKILRGRKRKSCEMEDDNSNQVSSEDVAKSMEIKSAKERHISIDSARDSGIGENSNFTDMDKFEVSDSQESCSAHFNPEVESDSASDLRGYWQPKIKKNMGDRLPPNSYYLMPPSKYLFPGAEVFYDPHEKCSYLDTSESSESESDADQESSRDNSF